MLARISIFVLGIFRDKRGSTSVYSEALCTAPCNLTGIQSFKERLKVASVPHSTEDGRRGKLTRDFPSSSSSDTFCLARTRTLLGSPTSTSYSNVNANTLTHVHSTVTKHISKDGWRRGCIVSPVLSVTHYILLKDDL